jgi:hypothetical protein
MTDPDYFVVLIANQILGGDFIYINMNLREATDGRMAQERVFTGTNAYLLSMLRHKFVCGY